MTVWAHCTNGRNKAEHNDYAWGAVSVGPQIPFCIIDNELRKRIDFFENDDRLIRIHVSSPNMGTHLAKGEGAWKARKGPQLQFLMEKAVTRLLKNDTKLSARKKS